MELAFLLIDMASEGVSTRPIKLISGKSPFCETFFRQCEGARKKTSSERSTTAGPSPNILLTHERQMIGGVGETDVRRRELHEIAKENLASSRWRIGRSRFTY